MDIEYKWSDGNDKDFQHFYMITEDYYSSLVGGKNNRKGFIQYNISSAVENVLIAYHGLEAVACAGLKSYNKIECEIKRVWVDNGYRRLGIAREMMKRLEEHAKAHGYKRLILQTREIMADAVNLYDKLGYYVIPNYPPYDKLDGAMCMAKDI